MILDTVKFEGLGRCFYQREGFRAPKKGEYYLSGAIVEAYLAPNDLSSPYHIVTPTYKAEQSTYWSRGERIK